MAPRLSHWAVRQDDQDMADRLISAGADVKAANRYGVTPLYLACVNGNAAMIEKLLNAGADAERRNHRRRDAADDRCAHRERGSGEGSAGARRGRGCERAMAAANTADVGGGGIASRDGAGVDRAGADVNARQVDMNWERQITTEPREKWLPLGGLYAAAVCRAGRLRGVREGSGECGRRHQRHQSGRLQRRSCSPSSTAITMSRRSCSIRAPIRTRRQDRPHAFICRGRLHTLPDSNRPWPSDLDNKLTSLDLIQALLAHGANVNTQLKNQQPYRSKVDRGDDTMLTTGTTPILRAAKAGDIVVVKLLLDKGADPKLATKLGSIPLWPRRGWAPRKKTPPAARRRKRKPSIHQALPGGGSGSECGEQSGPDRAARRGAKRLGPGGAVSGRSWREAGRERQERPHAAGRGHGSRGHGGFDGSRRDVHESTAALLRKLMAVPEAKTEQPVAQ